MNIISCRYCEVVPESEMVNGRWRTYCESQGANLSCSGAQYALTVIGDKVLTRRLSIKNWNASNDLNGPDIVEPEEM